MYILSVVTAFSIIKLSQKLDNKRHTR